MAKLALLLALTQSTLIHGLPARDEAHNVYINRAISILSDIGVTTVYSSAMPTLQSASMSETPTLTGVIQTSLPDPGFSPEPIKTFSLESTQTLAPIDGTLKPGPTKPLESAKGNVFVPMATGVPPQQVTSRDDHPVKKANIIDRDVPIETNKFYANLFLGNQTSAIWTQPYSLVWAKGAGKTWGMTVSHVERKQLAFGPDGQTPPRYFIAPVGIQQIVMSAKELGDDTVLSTEELTGFSAYANLAPSVNANPIISFPLVQGMGFVTGLYNKAKPQLNSGVFFRTLNYVEQLNGITFKYQITLEDDTHWLLYATPVGSLGAPPFMLKNNKLIEGPDGFVGSIQIAKNPADEEGEKVYDSTAGAFATNATISGTVDGDSGSYTLEWGKDGVKNQTLLMFTLPHQMESFDQASKDALTKVELVTTTKGYAKAVVADKITMVESELPASIGFGPWVPDKNGGGSGSENLELNPGALKLVQSSGAVELGQNFTAQTNLDSMYYSGKGLAKFAGIIYTVQTMGKDTELAAAGLVKLKDAIKTFIDNKQVVPLVYDDVWKGVVSSASYGGDLGQDFGNTLYNDHHFHYGYFVYTAAVIGHLDPAWLEEGSNKAWVNMLVRDFANPSDSDPYFPFQRSFDWYMCHSWAKGLADSGDGKDQESTSEDTFATYALKMWGKTLGDPYMEGRANLQLACQRRSLKNYFLLEDDNQVQPKQFVPNKVAGILFDNKVDHTTYFGAKPEMIQGIQMIPINPSSAYTRRRKFVQEEWDAYFSDGRADKAEGGWKGILYANQILIDPFAALEYFSNPKFDMTSLDGGASRTFYLAYAAVMAGNIPSGSKALGDEYAKMFSGETAKAEKVKVPCSSSPVQPEPVDQDPETVEPDTMTPSEEAPNAEPVKAPCTTSSTPAAPVEQDPENVDPGPNDDWEWEYDGDNEESDSEWEWEDRTNKNTDHKIGEGCGDDGEWEWTCKRRRRRRH